MINVYVLEIRQLTELIDVETKPYINNFSWNEIGISYSYELFHAPVESMFSSVIESLKDFEGD